MKKILLIEDNKEQVEAYSEEMRRAGFGVSVVSDGLKVMSAIEEVKPDLIVMDVMLPNIDGWEVLGDIKKISDAIKVIVVSELSQDHDVFRSLELGASKYLIREHYSPSEIVEEIKKILK